MEEDNSTQHEENSVVLTGVKQKQEHAVEAKSLFPVLRLAPLNLPKLCARCLSTKNGNLRNCSTPLRVIVMDHGIDACQVFTTMNNDRKRKFGLLYLTEEYL